MDGWKDTGASNGVNKRFQRVRCCACHPSSTPFHPHARSSLTVVLLPSPHTSLRSAAPAPPSPRAKRTSTASLAPRTRRTCVGWRRAPRATCSRPCSRLPRPTFALCPRPLPPACPTRTAVPPASSSPGQRRTRAACPPRTRCCPRPLWACPARPTTPTSTRCTGERARTPPFSAACAAVRGPRPCRPEC